MFPPDEPASAPEEAPLAQRLARGLDWWFAPRWRALLSWVGLLGISSVTMDLIGTPKLARWSNRPTQWLEVVLPIALPPVVTIIVRTINLTVALEWMEPFALRLSFARGMAWLGLRSIAAVALQVPGLYRHTGSPDVWLWGWRAAELFCSVGAAYVLRGWRSRPWMAPMGCMIYLAMLMEFWTVLSSGQRWIYLPTAICMIPNAVVLIYGTRLLRAEERGRVGVGGG